MKKQIVAIAVLASLIPISVFAAFTYTPPAPGFYMGSHRISTAQVQATLNQHGAAGIQFVPPPGPVVVRSVCGDLWYQYTYYPHPKGKRQEWLDVTGRATAEKLIRSCK